MKRTSRWIAIGSALGLTMGCAASKELAALRHVGFAFDHLSGPRIVGIPLGSVDSYDDLTPSNLTRIGVAIASNDMPFDVTVHVAATNSQGNPVNARLLAMDWTYLVEDKKIVEGKLSEAQALDLAPGQTRDVPVGITFNLMEAFEGSPQELFDTALVLSGQRTSGKKRTLMILPTLDTPAGPVRFPDAIKLDLSKPAKPDQP